MTAIFQELQLRGLRKCVSVLFVWLLAVWAIQARSIDPAAAQSVAKVYRIAAGDKIGVNVFGHPDLSSEATVDQSGNIRLPLIGEVAAVSLTLSELERSIAQAFTAGYVRSATVTARIVEHSPIYVLGLVRSPGVYPYREGISVLGAIARAGGISASDGQQGAMLGALLQAEERIRLLDASRVVLLAKRARLTALQNGDEAIVFPDMSGIAIDEARIVQIRDSEQRAFTAERQAVLQETETLEKQLRRLEAEIVSLKQQTELEMKQRTLYKELIAEYEQLNKTGLTRKATYIEVRREEARIDGNIGRLASDALKAELLIGELQLKIAELRNGYERRVSGELRDTERALLDLAVSLPAAHRLRAAYARQVGLLTAEQASQAVVTVIRSSGSTNIKIDAAADFALQPGDIVQIGPLFPKVPALDETGIYGGRAAEGETSSVEEGAPTRVN